MSTTRTMRVWRKALSPHGCTVERTRGDHIAIGLPDGDTVYAPSTASDRRSIRNMAADLRRRGIPVTWKALLP